LATAGRQKYERKTTARIPFIGSKSKAETELRSPMWALAYNFPWNPDPLCSGNNYNTYDEMIDDDQVKSALSIKKDMVVNTGWKITGDSDEANEFITDNFNHINELSGLDSSFDDVLRDMLSSYDYGFSITEPVYNIGKDGKYHYSFLKTRAPHSFKFNMDLQGNVVEILQSTSSKGEVGFKPSTFLHHVYQMQFGNPYGKSDLRAAYVAWKAKKFFLRFFAIYVERFASGTIVGKYPKNYSPGEVDEFYKTIKSIQNATTMAIPEDTELDFMQLERDAGGIYLKGLDYYNMQIARSILVPDLMGISGGSSNKERGSQALGREQFKVFLSSIKKDRESLSRKVTMKLVRPLVLANFGDVDCKFDFVPYSHGDIEDYLSLWVDFVKAGGYVPTDEDIEFFKTIIGFPEQKRSEKIARPEKKKDKTEIEEDTFSMGYFRELTKYEKKVDFERVENTFDRGERGIERELKTDTALIQSGLVSQVRDGGFLRKFKPAKIEKLQAKNLRQMNTTLKNYYVNLFTESLSEAKKEIFPQGDIKKFEIEMLPEEFLELLKVEAFKTVGDYAFEVTKKAKNMVIQGMKDGISEAGILKIIREELLSTSETWVQTVARTKTTEIYNEARKRYWETDPLAKQIVEAYQWSAILDNRTSNICRHMDGKIFKIGELSDWLKPPAHFNCRSILVPITKFEDYEVNPKSDFGSEKLKKLGGGLLSPGK